MTPIKILIADDHPVFRFGLKALIATEPDLEVVGEAATGKDAVVLANKLTPNLILMDINMPNLNGIEATQQIVQTRPDIGILILSMLDDETVFSAMRAGARGYLLKGSEGDATIQAIRVVAEGGTIFSPGIAERVMAYFSRGKRKADPFPELTNREREILDLIARGLTNQAIADQLVISPKTVRNQVSEIYSKLQVASRGEVVVKAKDAGFGQSH
ncbi:MAG TPA: response regulator transcription factor [Anaerolineales bacterium]|nr:response regulator transcription factor [Anaerolineales bacterium]